MLLCAFLLAPLLHAAEPPATQVIELDAGWNLVSFQVGTSLTPAQFQAALGPADASKLKAIWSFGDPIIPGSAPWQWKFYRTDVGQPNDLTTLQPGKGYWVDVSGYCQATLTGTPWNGSVTIKPGWNLVGFPGAMLAVNEQQELAALFGPSFSSITQVWAWDSSSAQRFTGYDITSIPQVKELTTAQPGRGYWVYSISAESITLTPQPFLALPADGDASPPQEAEAFQATDPRWLGSNPAKYAGKTVRFRAGNGSDTPYDLNNNGILDEPYTQDTILFEKTADTVSITIGNSGSGSLSWTLENTCPWIYTAPADDRTWPEGVTLRPRNGSGTVSSDKDVLLLYADRTAMTPGRKTSNITLWVGGTAYPISLLLDVADVTGDWRGFATTNRVGGRNISLGEVRLVLNSFTLGATTATATANVAAGQVTGINVTNQGTGYETVPQVVITGTGTGAMATATVQNKRVTSIAVTSPGTGYDGTTTVTIASPSDVEADGFRAVLNREQSILFPRDVYMDGVFYAANQFKLTTNFEMKAGDRNAPPYNVFPGNPKDRDVNGDGKVDVMNPFPFGIRREVTLLGTRVSPDRLEGTYIESIRGMMPPLSQNTRMSDTNQFFGSDFETRSEPVFIEGTFVLERQSFTPTRRSVFNESAELGLSIGGSDPTSRSVTFDVTTPVTVQGVTLTLNLTFPDPALIQIALIGPNPNDNPYVIHEFGNNNALPATVVIPPGTFTGAGNGIWTLQIDWDGTTGERGTLAGWGLNIEGASTHHATGRIVRGTGNAQAPIFQPVQPIPSATLRLEGGVTAQSIPVAADGTFTIPALTENDYTLFISKPGYKATTFTFFISENDEALGDIPITPLLITEPQLTAAPPIGYAGTQPLHVEFTVDLPLNFGGTTIAWDFDGNGTTDQTGPIATLTEVAHDYATPGIYTAKVTFSGSGVPAENTFKPQVIHVHRGSADPAGGTQQVLVTAFVGGFGARADATVNNLGEPFARVTEITTTSVTYLGPSPVNLTSGFVFQESIWDTATLDLDRIPIAPGAAFAGPEDLDLTLNHPALRYIRFNTNSPNPTKYEALLYSDTPSGITT
jgi:subtilisin-like proprotein convertase family protein